MQKNLGGLVNRASKKKLSLQMIIITFITLKKYSILLIEYLYSVFLCIFVQ